MSAPSPLFVQRDPNVAALARLGAFAVPVMDRDLGVADRLTGAAS